MDQLPKKYKGNSIFKMKSIMKNQNQQRGIWNWRKIVKPKIR